MVFPMLWFLQSNGLIDGSRVPKWFIRLSLSILFIMLAFIVIGVPVLVVVTKCTQ